jgi:thiaminase/transcriptional activator TenA
MLPCPWTYNEISQQIVDGAAPDNPFLPWIEFYQPQTGQIDDSMVKNFMKMGEKTCSFKDMMNRLFFCT